MRNLRSTITRLAVASAAAAGLSFVATTPAWANNATDTNPASGSQTTPFIFDTQQAACPTATINGGDILDSFVVDNASVSTNQIGQLTFPAANGFLPTNTSTGGTYTGAILFTSPAGNQYQNQPTLPPNPPSVQGPWGGDTQGPFSWANYVGDFGPGLDLHNGTFNIGIACVNNNTGAIDNNQFWSLQVTFTGTSTAFTWTSAPGPTTPEVPFAIILPLSAVAILLGGGVLFYRRKQRVLVADA
jgi:hypothetical protein